MQLVSITRPTPADDFVDKAQWLLSKGSAVVRLDALDDYTVRMVVEDPFVTSADERENADRLVADSAFSVLEQVEHGVRLIAQTRSGYTGRASELAPAQLTFIGALPGVQHSDLRPASPVAAGDDFVYVVEARDQANRDRIDWLLRDRFDVGTVQDGPVRVVVPAARP